MITMLDVDLYLQGEYVRRLVVIKCCYLGVSL